MLGFGAAAVGKAIQGMYKNLNDSGFKPGEEFVVAVREGQRIGADIVLGDQDVEVTLRRMTQALAQTDLNKLLDPDSELERGMRELMGDSDPSLASSPDAFKSELSTYVENMKTRDSVRKIMAQLQKVAPALVQVMLTERDAYMAAGLDTLNQFEVITAVMGIAHMDGVERNLQSQGWKQMRPSCPRV
jgi:pheromone shutdown protein TraB